MPIFLAIVDYAESEEQYLSLLEFGRNDDVWIASEVLVVGVFSSMEKAKESISYLVPEVEWCSGDDDEEYAEWTDEKPLFFKNPSGKSRYVTFISVERMVVDDIHYWIKNPTVDNQQH